MDKKEKPNFDEVLLKVRQANIKTRELLQRADLLHAAVEAAHQRADELHRRIDDQRENARKARDRKQRRAKS